MTPYSDKEIQAAYELVRGAFECVLGESCGTFEEFKSEPEGVAIMCELLRAARASATDEDRYPRVDPCELGGEG
jgi:hypothetical protein